jgi:heptosyltransferase-2
MPKLKPETLRRIVVRGTNWVGDAVMTIPALRELRQLLPDAHITLATRSWARGLFADADFIDDFLICDARGFWSVPRQVSQSRNRDFDLAVLFTNSFETALIPALARIPARVGYATEHRGKLLTVPLPLPEWRNERHEIFYYLNIIGELEHEIAGRATILDRQPNCALEISSDRQEEAQALLKTYGVTSDRPIVALCPGSINSRAKRWSADSYAALADRLIVETGAHVLLIGSAAELEVSSEVTKLMKHTPVVLTGKTDLAQVVAVLSQVDLLITNDTGPAHITSALGRATLVIFGPTNPVTTRPYSRPAEILRHPPDCAPCMLRDCPIDHRCMTAISPEDVWQRARFLMMESPQRSVIQGVRG